MAYAVKEIFETLQGEGAHSGRAPVFCRFAGCNLWSGREEDRSAAVCGFCDTDFIGMDGTGGGRFADAEALAYAVEASCAGAWDNRFVVLTGGEPLLQVDAALTSALRARGFECAVETNGTQPRPVGIDWLCVSPKAGPQLAVQGGDELKLVYPQTGVDPEALTGLGFRHFFLQAMDGPEREANVASAIAYCLEHSRWRLSLQTHKMIGIP